MQPDGADRWARAPRVLWRLAPDRVLVRIVGGDGLDLTGLAALVWVALDEPRRLDALCDELSTVDSTATTDAVVAIITDLVDRGLLEVAP